MSRLPLEGSTQKKMAGSSTMTGLRRARTAAPGAPLLAAALLASIVLVAARPSSAQSQILSAELSFGAGLSAYNTGSDELLAPPHVQLLGAYHFLRMGNIAMGPALAVPLGFYDDSDEGTRVQLALSPGWSVYGRPSVDWAWNAVATAAFVVTDPFVFGLEFAGSAAYFLTAGLALTAGLQYGFFYGVDPVHVFSGKLGVLIAFEVGS